jgi:hypothetical protein
MVVSDGEVADVNQTICVRITADAWQNQCLERIAILAAVAALFAF